MNTKESAAEKRRKILLPPYAWGCLGVCLFVQTLVFFFTRPLLPYLPSYKISLSLDAAIPFIPEWVSVYCLAFLSWAVSAVIILAQGKARAYRFTSAYATAMLLSGVIFLSWPLTIERPQVEGTGFLRDLLRYIYQADEPNNLFPSLHVLASYFCWRGLWGCSHIPRWFKGFNFVFLILVCLSVVFIKQHLSIDIPGGIIVGEMGIQLSRLLPLKTAD